MKKILLMLSICLTLTRSNERTINKGTAYEAKLFIKNKTLYLTHHAKSEKLLSINEEPSEEDEPAIYEDTIEYKIEDINFDNIDDILIVTLKVYGGVNIYYNLYLSHNGKYVSSNISLSNYQIGKNNTILSEYKDGARYFTDIYKVNKKHELIYFATFEKYD